MLHDVMEGKIDDDAIMDVELRHTDELLHLVVACFPLSFLTFSL